MQKIKPGFILIDLDGTLIDFVSMKKRTARAAARAMCANGLKAKENDVYKRIFEVYDEHGYGWKFRDVGLWYCC